MTVSKCECCYRREVCSLRPMAELTLPWVAEARDNRGTEWERAHRIKRVLRGCGSSPGFIEDWSLAGALIPEDVVKMVKVISTYPADIGLAQLCSYCRHYQGPPINDCCSDGEAA